MRKESPHIYIQICTHIHTSDTSREIHTHIWDIKRLASVQLSTGACAFSPVSASWRTDPVCTSVPTSSSSSPFLSYQFLSHPLLFPHLVFSSFLVSEPFFPLSLFSSFTFTSLLLLYPFYLLSCHCIQTSESGLISVMVISLHVADRFDGLHILSSEPDDSGRVISVICSPV